MPNVKRQHSTRQQGFSLVQVSLMIAVAGIVMVSVLPGGQVGSDNEKILVTRQRMNKIEEAMRAFMARDYRRPCPADGSIAFDTANFGVEADNNGVCAAGVPAANFLTGNIAAGAVPTKTLNLPDEYAVDGYGRRFTYVVDVRATTQQACFNLQSQGTKGDVQILSTYNAATAADYVMGALLSHGKDGHGAFSLQGSTVANRIDMGSADNDTWNNAAVLDATFATNFTGKLVRKSPTATFDDEVWYLDAQKNTCCLGTMCSLGSYITGNRSGDSWNQIVTGDLNGDNIEDIVVPMLRDSTAGNPAIYIIYGKKTAWTVPPTNTLITALADGTSGIRLTLPNGGLEYLKHMTMATGDTNGDGIDDLIVSSAVDPDGLGAFQQLWLIRGRKATGASPSWSANCGASCSISALADATNGFVWKSTIVDAGAVAAGDVNGDGKKDVIFVSDDNTGYIMLGKTAAWACSWGVNGASACNLATASTTIYDVSITNGGAATHTFKISAVDYNDASNIATGDFNQDGYDDIVFTTSDTIGTYVGRSFVLFGRSSWGAAVPPTPNAINLSTQAAGSQIATIYSTLYDGLSATHVQFGATVTAGDVNNDNIKDLIFTSLYQNIEIYYGNTTAVWPVAAMDLNANPYNTTGFRIDHNTNAPADPSPPIVGQNRNNWITNIAVGDMTGDNRADILLGNTDALDGATEYVGAVYLLAQPSTGWTTNTAYSLFTGAGAINTPTFKRIRRLETDNLTGTLAIADVNRDGRRDLLIGAAGYPVITIPPPGILYILYGRKNTSWDNETDLDDLLTSP
jgi:hypothetical protein